MGRIWRRLVEVGRWLQIRRYRAQQERRELDDQRFQDREARHRAGIFERPNGGE